MLSSLRFGDINSSLSYFLRLTPAAVVSKVQMLQPWTHRVVWSSNRRPRCSTSLPSSLALDKRLQQTALAHSAHAVFR